jgi:muramoyltetrapeptide carboxypeptidase
VTPGERVFPPALLPGDQIRVVAPSGPFEIEPFQAGLDLIRAAGFRPAFDDTVFARSRYLAGDDERRSCELAAAIGSPEERAIWVARGGYGASRIVPRIDLEAIRRTPKWLVGFSDVTALHALWSRAGLVSLHGPNVTTLPEWSESARERTWGWLGAAPGQRLEGRCVAGRGAVEGALLGGNLSILAALVGTGNLPSFAGAVVLLEDIGERPYRLDRALHQLFLAGVFDGVAGFVVGQLPDCEEPAERCADYDGGTVVAELLASRGVPVLTDVPIGHEPSSYPAALGARATIDCDSGVLTLHGRPDAS